DQRMYGGVFFFFFSSRRRHTRFSRDWSSDVCSSDLGLYSELDNFLIVSISEVISLHEKCSGYQTNNSIFSDIYMMECFEIIISRSEERRVGKECRARWSRSH